MLAPRQNRLTSHSSVTTLDCIVRHLLTAFPFLAAGAALVGYAAYQWDRKLVTARNYWVAGVLVFCAITIMSATSTVTEVRCPDNPADWCLYNDSTPMMAVFAIGYLIACGIKSWFLYAER